MRAVLFVAQAHLQRSLGRELGRLGFDVILPVTLDEARQALKPSLQAPDLVVMNLRDADGGTLDLLGVISRAEVKMPVVLVAEATDVSTARHQISMDGVVVLPSELDSFSRSVRLLCGLQMRGWFGAGHEDSPGTKIRCRAHECPPVSETRISDHGRLAARYETRE